MELTFFDSIFILLIAVVFIVVICQRIKFPAIIGYILIGGLLGPHVMRIVPEMKFIHEIADFGVVFLMFTIGLEFSISKMLKLKHLVFGLGSAQVILTFVLTAIIGTWVSMTWTEAVVVACIVAMSSTAIVSKQLTDQNELRSAHGQQAISILLFQDLAVIPFFILISSFAINEHSIGHSLLLSLGKAVIAMSIIIAVGRWVLRPIFHTVAQLESLELFTLIVLLVTLGSAWLTHKMGLSLALGAFLAGMMLGETEFRHQIEATIRPFRDILLGLFFITVGMLFDLSVIAEIWPWVLLLLTALTLLKILLIGFLSYFPERKVDTALRTGLVLAQGGEFGFALLTLAMSENLLPILYGQVVLGALLFSMALTPIIIRYNEKIVCWLLPSKVRGEEVEEKTEVKELTRDLKNHVILCGFSRVGQQLANILDDEAIPYIAIDYDHLLVQNAQSAGCSVIYGDASMYEILDATKIQQAKALVLTFDNLSLTEKILPIVRSHLKNIPIFVRTKDDSDLEKLQKLGATEVIPASLELSLTLASHLLISLGVHAEKIAGLMNKIRKTRYHLLREVIPGEGYYN